MSCEKCFGGFVGHNVDRRQGAASGLSRPDSRAGQFPRAALGKMPYSYFIRWPIRAEEPP